MEPVTEWRKASRSTANGGACVEVARLSTSRISVRDSKDPEGDAIDIEPDRWGAFVARLKSGTVGRH